MAEVGWRNLNVVFRQAGYILAGGEKTNKYQQHGVVSSIGQRLPRRTGWDSEIRCRYILFI